MSTKKASLKINKSCVLLVLLSGIFIASVILPQIYAGQDRSISRDDRSTKPDLKTSSLFGPAIIHINDNWTHIASNYSWCSGMGSPSNPYVIQGLVIDAESNITSCLLIQNSNTDYFVIKNCTFVNTEIYNSKSWSAGIKIINSSRGIINNNTFNNNVNNGVYVGQSCAELDIFDNSFYYVGEINSTDDLHAIKIESGSANITISENRIYNHDKGIGIYGNSTQVLIENNTIEAFSHGIYLQKAYSPVVISGNSLNHGGIFFEGVNSSHMNNHVIYQNNTLNGDVIYYFVNRIDHMIGSVYGNAGQIILVNGSGCDIVGHFLSSINLYYSINNTIRYNTIEDCWNGIYLKNCSTTIIDNNTIKNCYNGLYDYYGETNVITNNTVYNNTYAGITLHFSDLNNMTNNDVHDNRIGIQGLITSNNNNITSNDIYRNEIGIYEINTFNNSINNNYIHDNLGDGISIFLSSFISIENNTISFNEQYGISLRNCLNTTISGNNISYHDYALLFVQSDSSIVTFNILAYYIENRTEIDSKWNLFSGNTYIKLSDAPNELDDPWDVILMATLIISSVSVASGVPFYVLKKKKKIKPKSPKTYKQSLPVEPLDIQGDNRKVIDIFDDKLEGIDPSRETLDLTLYTAEFLKEIDSLGFSFEEKSEFLNDMRLFTPKERMQIVNNMKNRLREANLHKHD